MSGYRVGDPKNVIYQAISPFGADVSTTTKQAAKNFRREGWTVRPFVSAERLRRAVDALDGAVSRLSPKQALQELHDLLDEAEM